MRIAVATALFTSLLASSPAFAAESAYTTLDFNNDSCKPMGAPPTQEDKDLGVSALLCPGLKGYPVQYNSGDERETVHYGDPATATTKTAWESFVPFNSMAENFEWRLEHGVPFAAIHRFMISTGDEDPAKASAPVKGQVLVISKVSQPNGPAGCVVGLVDALANVGANELARKVADEVAPGFKCGRDKAVYHGKRGKKSGRLPELFHRRIAYAAICATISRMPIPMRPWPTRRMRARCW
jgi:hypothetical protein